MKSLTRNWQWVVCALTVTACSAPMPLDDAGVPAGDAGTFDAGLDAGVDAGLVLKARWAPVHDTPVATGLWGAMLAFDPVDRRFILHGGNTYPAATGVTSDTWSYSIAADAWTKLTTSGDAPPVRYCHCTTYLPAQRQVLIVGGRNNTTTVDSAYTLDLATNTWSAINGTVPSGAIGCLAHWLPKSSRAVVFGGEGMSGLNQNTWSYDPVGRAFTLLSPPTKLAARRDPMSAYDPVSEKVLVFGGAVQIRSTYLDDLGTFDGTTWTSVAATTPRPSARRYGASGFDAVHGRWLLFGGTNDTDDSGDLWALDPQSLTFSTMTASGAPFARGFAASGIDEVTGRLFLFGGLDTGFNALADGFALELRLEAP